ncbi:MAG: N-acetyltransferase [Acinetobacter sp.]|uniref:GNAT family N-acetyltransferase n=1 Tax=Acinetobacter sp. TaxID=472 RepID=UPI000F9AC75D|nr:GNAT family protein [Acinetobacter sp.]RUP39725.1 MAG: N-acetyltransferase [Acinetobacter sp.]
MKNYLKTQQNEFGQNVGFSLKHNLSIQPISGTLKGQYINLIDVAEGLSEQAASLIWDCVVTEPSEECWTYLPYSAPQSQIALKNNLQNLFGFKDSTHFLIEVDGEVQGWIALLNPRLGHAAIEIGNVYFSHKMKKSKAATEAIFLLLKQCFKYGFRRVEWKCDDANAPSKAAALRFGFQYEGLFRQDRIVKNRNRNTAWFSIIDEEWSNLDQAYQQWLSPENFDAQGFQKQRLSDFNL